MELPIYKQTAMIPDPFDLKFHCTVEVEIPGTWKDRDEHGDPELTKQEMLEFAEEGRLSLVLNNPVTDRLSALAECLEQLVGVYHRSNATGATQQAMDLLINAAKERGTTIYKLINSEICK
jgi:hypothetical protein